MLIPVRCYTCGKVVGNKWQHYNDLLKEGKTQPQAFSILGLKRYCCKRIILGHIDIVDTLMAYDKPNPPVEETIEQPVEQTPPIIDTETPLFEY